MKRYLGGSLILGIAVIVAVMNGCGSGGLPSEVTQQSAEPAKTAFLEMQALDTQITVGGSTRLVVRGGAGTYRFSVTGGAATVSADGILTGTAAGTAYARVEDDSQQFATFNVTVVAPPVVVTPTEPTTPPPPPPPPPPPEKKTIYEFFNDSIKYTAYNDSNSLANFSLRREAFKLYVTQESGTVPLYVCKKNNVDGIDVHWLTIRSNCEWDDLRYGRPVRTLGYIYNNPAANTTALHRWGRLTYDAAGRIVGDHFYNFSGQPAQAGDEYGQITGYVPN